jgi:hypothetical protein
MSSGSGIPGSVSHSLFCTADESMCAHSVGGVPGARRAEPDVLEVVVTVFAALDRELDAVLRGHAFYLL